MHLGIWQVGFTLSCCHWDKKMRFYATRINTRGGMPQGKEMNVVARVDVSTKSCIHAHIPPPTRITCCCSCLVVLPLLRSLCLRLRSLRVRSATPVTYTHPMAHSIGDYYNFGFFMTWVYNVSRWCVGKGSHHHAYRAGHNNMQRSVRCPACIDNGICGTSFVLAWKGASGGQNGATR